MFLKNGSSFYTRTQTILGNLVVSFIVDGKILRGSKLQNFFYRKIKDPLTQNRRQRLRFITHREYGGIRYDNMATVDLEFFQEFSKQNPNIDIRILYRSHGKSNYFSLQNGFIYNDVEPPPVIYRRQFYFHNWKLIKNKSRRFIR